MCEMNPHLSTKIEWTLLIFELVTVEGITHPHRSVALSTISH